MRAPASNRANLADTRTNLPAWFNHVGEVLLITKFSSKRFCSPVESSYPPAPSD